MSNSEDQVGKFVDRYASRLQQLKSGKILVMSLDQSDGELNLRDIDIIGMVARKIIKGLSIDVTVYDGRKRNQLRIKRH